MEDKIARELLKQLTRIADALDKQNNREEATEKRKLTVEKLHERNLRAELREKMKCCGTCSKYRTVNTGSLFTGCIINGANKIHSEKCDKWEMR